MFPPMSTTQLPAQSISYMYEMLVVRPGTPDDEYGDQRINNILALLKDPMECSGIG